MAWHALCNAEGTVHGMDHKCIQRLNMAEHRSKLGSKLERVVNAFKKDHMAEHGRTWQQAEKQAGKQGGKRVSSVVQAPTCTFCDISAAKGWQCCSRMMPTTMIISITVSWK